jgi:hypothetical protein
MLTINIMSFLWIERLFLLYYIVKKNHAAPRAAVFPPNMCFDRGSRKKLPEKTLFPEIIRKSTPLASTS